MSRAKSTRQSIERICPSCQQSFLALATEVNRGGGIFCSRACRYKSQERPLLERFWAKVVKTDGCWLWTGGRGPNGYGLINRGNHTKTLYAHRLSWEIHCGPIPDGLCALHDCDKNHPAGDVSYRLCVNPSHLWLGDRGDNARDMVAKGRTNNATGEDHRDAKLTWAAVRSMRGRHQRGDATTEQLAAEARVHPTTVLALLRNQTWKE